MPAPAVASLVLAALAVGAVIVALLGARGPTEVPDYQEYLRRWRSVHDLEPDRMVGGFVESYLRLPYAVARPPARRGVDPNVVTLVGLIVAGSSIPAYLLGGRWLALGGFAVLLSGLCDQLDGATAVLQSRTTAFGAIWDSTADRVSDLALLAGPAAWLVRDVGGDRADWGLVGLATAGASIFLLEYVRARCQAVGHVQAQVVTPAERPTRVVVAGVLGLACGAVAAGDADPASAGLLWVWGSAGLATLTLVSVGLLLADAARRPTPDLGPNA